MIRYSVVVPMNNEEENVSPLISELDSVLDRLEGESEILVVDDGSTDSTRQRLAETKKEFSRLRILLFDRNYGQSAAFAAGFRHAQGEVVITMDGDCQNDPADIPRLLEHIPEYDAVIGMRFCRRDSTVRRLSSVTANAVRNWLTGDRVTDTGCSLKAFRSEYAQKIPWFTGMHRFLPTLVRFYGAKVLEVPVNHRERERGTAHYGISNRALIALHDAFAVRWMRKRVIDYTIERIEK